MKIKNSDKLIAIALRNFASKMLDNPNAYSIDDGRSLDRALRSCPAISDIDTVWVRWRYVGENRGWLTHSEMYHDGRTYKYPSLDGE